MVHSGGKPVVTLEGLIFSVVPVFARLLSQARAMADHARTCAKSDYTLATTGVAGPSGGSPERPVGTVYVALAASGKTIVKKFFFPTDRETFKQIVTQAALELLRRRLIVGM